MLSIRRNGTDDDPTDDDPIYMHRRAWGRGRFRLGPGALVTQIRPSPRARG
jgi:hypothetical protein